MLLMFVLAGAMVGSFLNVCIYRIPQERSVLKPGSACPKCGDPIRFYDNIPVLGYFFLKGKCRSCHQKISLQYPLVELISTFVTIFIYVSYGFSFQAFVYIIFVYLLIVVTFIDLQQMIIPDILVLLLILTGITNLFNNGNAIEWKEPIVGLFLYGGFLYLIGEAGKLILNKDAMGLGDVKLGAAVGLFLGWKMSLVSLFLAFVSGSVIGISGMAMGSITRGQQIPFGPYIALGTVMTLFFGESILNLYLGFILL